MESDCIELKEGTHCIIVVYCSALRLVENKQVDKGIALLETLSSRHNDDATLALGIIFRSGTIVIQKLTCTTLVSLHHVTGINLYIIGRFYYLKEIQRF